MDTTNTWIDIAEKKLNEESKAGTYDRYAKAMKDYVLTALKDFIRQDEEFAQAVAQGGTFNDCMKAVAKGCGNSISDLEVCQRAAQFYFPGAKIHFQMVIDLIGDAAAEEEKPAIDACERFSITLVQLINKIKTQKDLITWLDYTDMATTLEYDLTAMNDLFPKNLQERHDTAAENLRIRTNEEKERAYQKRREKLEKKFGFTADGLTIVVPSGIDDIVAEGKTLHICVGGYANRHVEGKTTILFLRHERRPERSFLCIELNDKGSIVQIHGYQNERYPNSISPRIRYKDWLEQWQTWYMAGSHRDRAGNPIIPKERESMSA